MDIGRKLTSTHRTNGKFGEKMFFPVLLVQEKKNRCVRFNFMFEVKLV